jgi:DNA polymerase III delta prime subunit
MAPSENDLGDLVHPPDITPSSERTFSELLRPRQFGDLMLPQRITHRFEEMYSRGRPMNVLFYGPPGTGKTSAARIFTATAGLYSGTEINGSSETGVEFIRTGIKRFASSVSFKGGVKICFIDEADYLSSSAQAALRKVIEDSQKKIVDLFSR